MMYRRAIRSLLPEMREVLLRGVSTYALRVAGALNFRMDMRNLRDEARYGGIL